MKNKLLSALLAMSMMLSLTACGGNNNDSSDNGSVNDNVSQTEPADSSQPDSGAAEEYEGNWYDVNELYQAILAEQPEELEPLNMFDESENKDLIMNYYPNFYNCDYEQMLYYAPATAGYPSEIMIVQTKTEREADYIEAEFVDRIEIGAADVSDPENAESWVLRAEVQRDGNFVVMIVLPEEYEIPYVFGLI